ncbi:LOW QUALITY PROTEIN: centriolar coiled-coil protein of 110 kDa-like [Pholidichthys leucotaenia]
MKETQWRAQVLEDMQRRLEKEDAFQMALLLAEQEREQQRLCLELEDAGKRLKEQRHVRPLSAALLTAEHQKAFCQMGALIRGFLTRRVLKTEKVKYPTVVLTIVDTREFIKSFQAEAQQKTSSSAQDLSLQERVRAQLRAALYDIHDIFFDMPLGDRLALLQQGRELRAERKLRDMEKAKSSKEKVILSAATQRSLDRKKVGLEGYSQRKSIWLCVGRVCESPGQTRKMQQKPKNPTTNRVLKQTQDQSSPARGQLNHQGSWYRKTPEERVRRSDSLKKQHSLR